ncbi:MAG: lysophospholipid acyltransferase family protein [Desulfobacterales bacterium]|nr:lysophospholipid acyltransferase family protein [Desulfobacterales bacterium]
MLDTIIYKIIRAIFRVFGVIPRRVSVYFSKVMGNIWFFIDKQHRNIALENLTRAFGREKTQQEIKILAKKVFQNIALVLFEIGWTMGLNKKEIHKYFTVKGLNNLNKAVEKGRGVLLLTGHMGNWELLTFIAAMTNHKYNIVYRQLDFPPLEKFFFDLRTRFGATMIPNFRGAMRLILKALNKRECVGMLLDQSVNWDLGVFADFFGIRTSTNKGMALISLKTGAPVVPVFIKRKGFKFEAEFEKEIPFIDTGDKIKDVEESTFLYNKRIENFIRQYPEQWFWVHRRWKIAPYSSWPKKKHFQK